MKSFKIFHLIIFVGLSCFSWGCACEIKENNNHLDRLIFFKTFTSSEQHLIKALNVKESISQIIYNQNSKKLNISLKPALPSYNAIRMNLEFPLNKNSFSKIEKRKIGRETINRIILSLSSTYSAWAGNAGEVILLKNDRPYINIHLKNEIIDVAFSNNERFLAVGDRKGNIYLIDIATKKITLSKNIFKKEITSLSFVKNNQLLIAGESPYIYKLNAISKSIKRIINIQSIKDKVYEYLSINPCLKERTNRWDYCQTNRLQLWDTNSGKQIHKIDLDFIPLRIISVPTLQTLIIVDYDHNLWGLSFETLNLRKIGNLKSSLYLLNNNQKVPFKYGRVNEMFNIPKTNYLLLTNGSYFESGHGFSLVEISKSSFKNIARIDITSQNIFIFISEHLI